TCAARLTHIRMRMLRRAGMPEPGSFGSTFFFLGGAPFAVGGSPSGAALTRSRGVPIPRMLASSAIRLAAARFIAAGSFPGADFVASTSLGGPPPNPPRASGAALRSAPSTSAALEHPQELPQPLAFLAGAGVATVLHPQALPQSEPFAGL